MTNPERFEYPIESGVYTQVEKSDIKAARFGHVAGDLESGIQSGNFFDPKPFESRWFCLVNDFLDDFLSNTYIFPACDL